MLLLRSSVARAPPRPLNGLTSSGGSPLTETDYFRHLEMRVSRELAGMRQRDLRNWWCDGFLPEKFVVTGNGCHVSGKVWIDNGRTQTLWNFVVLLGPSLKSFDGVDWATLIP